MCKSAREPDNLPALPLNVALTPLITGFLLWCRVIRCPVNFDNDMAGCVSKVGKVPTNRVLPSEPVACLGVLPIVIETIFLG